MAEIKITISAENKDVIAKLKEIVGAADKTGNELQQAGSKGSAGLKEASNSAGGLSRSLADTTIIAAGVVTAIRQIKDSITAALKPGFEFSKSMETSRLGIAGIIMSMTNLHGKTLNLQQSLSVADQLLKQMQDYSQKIGLPMDAMTEGFQAMLGPGLAAKMTLEQVVTLTGIGMKAVKAFGLENRQIAQEMRDLLSGNISMDSTIAKSLNITGGDIQRAKQSADGLFKYLMDKFKGMQEIAKAYPDTLSGGMERLKNVFTVGSADAMKGLFDGLKQKVKDLFNAIADVNQETGKMSLKPEVKRSFTELSDAVLKILDSCIKIGISLGPALLASIKAIATVLGFIADHARAIGIAFAAWLTIDKVKSYLVGIRGELIKTKATVTGLTVAFEGAKVAARSILISTGWGILAVAIGYAADEALQLYENLTKAKNAKADYFKEKEKQREISNRSIPEQLEGKLQQPVYKLQGVSEPSLDQKTMDKMERFIAAINYMYPDNSVTVTSMRRSDDPGSDHYGGRAADIVIQGMEDPLFRNQLRLLAQDFGLTFLDEIDKPANPEKKDMWGPHIHLSDGEGGGGVNPNDVTANPDITKDPWETVEAANKRAVAQMENDTAVYLNGLDVQLQALEAKHASNLISESEYFEQKKTLEYQQADAAVKMLEQKAAAQKDLIDKAGKYKTPSEISDMGNVVLGLEKELVPARQKLEALAADIKNLGVAADGVSEAKIQAMMAALREYESTNNYEAQHPGGAYGAYQFMPGTWELKAPLAGLPADAPMTKENQDAVARAWILDILKKTKGRMSAVAEAWLGGDGRIGLSDDKLAGIRDSNGTSMLDYRSKVMDVYQQKLAQMPNMAENISGLSPDFAKYLQEQESRLMEELKIYADRLEAEGKTVEAQLIRSEVDYRATIQQLTANKQTNALSDVFKIKEIKNARVEVDKLFSDIDTAKAKFANDVADLAKQALSPEEYMKRLTVLMADFDSVTSGKLKRITELNDKVLKDPALAQKIKQILTDSLKVGSDSIYSLVETEKSKLENKLTALEQQYAAGGMDSITYEREKLALQQEYARIILEQVIPALQTKAALEGPDAVNKVEALKASLEGLKDQIDPLQNEFRGAAKSGLQEFFENGIQQCANLRDAFRSLVVSILNEMNKISSRRMAESLSAGMGDWLYNTFGDRKTTAQKNAGGGEIEGPGTGTSDSILSWLSNGEFVVKAASVKKYGSSFFHALNRGFLPKSILPKFATGGLVGKVADGADKFASSLVNSTSIPLKIINLNDPNEIGKYLASRPGEKVMVNWMKNNAGTVRQILRIK